MKKQYNTPEIEISVLRKANIILTSDGKIPGGSGDGGGNAEGRRRGQGSWDDDED